MFRSFAIIPNADKWCRIELYQPNEKTRWLEERDMKPAPEKHLPYYNLLDTLANSSKCCLCELETQSETRYFESLLYEYVNDVSLREQLVKCRGYCSYHAHYLLGINDALGTAIIYNDQMELAIKLIQQLRNLPSFKKDKRLEGIYRQSKQCPACVFLAQKRKSLLELFVESLAEDEFRKNFEDSVGLCLLHMLLALTRVKDNALFDYLLDIQLKKFIQLKLQLQEFLKKSDYQYKDVGYGIERDAWKRAVWVLAGYSKLLDGGDK